eukprot:TRINITY_DN78823_c0_g1_i4.p1 TRINITY_DN78823_c0_g1~~TRINITY_DN78823_c0_g1_i4.p1  ORF type:complete len:268 (+),score=47.50 TRINITY_DN78823_c0_g1_i4:174-977(+)
MEEEYDDGKFDLEDKSEQRKADLEDVSTEGILDLNQNQNEDSTKDLILENLDQNVNVIQGQEISQQVETQEEIQNLQDMPQQIHSDSTNDMVVIDVSFVDLTLSPSPQQVSQEVAEVQSVLKKLMDIYHGGGGVDTNISQNIVSQLQQNEASEFNSSRNLNQNKSMLEEFTSSQDGKASNESKLGQDSVLFEGSRADIVHVDSQQSDLKQRLLSEGKEERLTFEGSIGNQEQASIDSLSVREHNLGQGQGEIPKKHLKNFQNRIEQT